MEKTTFVNKYILFNYSGGIFQLFSAKIGFLLSEESNKMELYQNKQNPLLLFGIKMAKPLIKNGQIVYKEDMDLDYVPFKANILSKQAVLGKIKNLLG